MTNPSLSGMPKSAILMASDGISLFAELPGPNNRPVIIRYPLTIAGLSSALSLVRTRTFDTLDRPYMPLRPQGHHGTAQQRDNAQAILRRHGAIR